MIENAKQHPPAMYCLHIRHTKEAIKQATQATAPSMHPASRIKETIFFITIKV